jgi:hypothetical protein
MCLEIAFYCSGPSSCSQIDVNECTVHCKQFSISVFPKKDLAKPHSQILTKYLQS